MSCQAQGCPLPNEEGSPYCLAHIAAPPQQVDLSRQTRQQDFALGAGVQHLRLPGLPSTKGSQS